MVSKPGFWQKSRKWLKVGWLIAAGLVAIYVGVIAPRERARGLADEKQTGLGATDKVALMGGLVGGEENREFQATGSPAPPPPPGSEDRKLVRTASLDLIVKNPASAAEQVRQLAERLGGYLENSQVSGSDSAASASLTIRVPVARFEEARAGIRKLGVRVDSDRLDAQDVTKDYVDREARLRNLHAKEQQYLGILKRAATVKETLEVSEQLDNVRGEIEQQQSEFNALSKQVETVAITVSLNAEADAQVFGLNWRPLYRLKIAAREGLESLGDYVSTITALVFYLPTILLWLATILICAALGWRILRWAARVLFVSNKFASSKFSSNKPVTAGEGNN